MMRFLRFIIYIHFFSSIALVNLLLGSGKFGDITIEEGEKLAKHYNGLNSKFKKEIDLIFSLEPILTNVEVEIKVGREVIDKIFVDLMYTAKMAKKYSRSRYNVKALTATRYYAEELPHIKGTLEMFYLRPGEKRFIYLVDGTYQNVINLVGKMLIDVRYRVRSDGTAVFNIKSYIVLTNKFLWSMTKFFRFFPKVRVKIDRIINYNVVYIVAIGKRVAMAIKRYGF